MIVHRKSVRRWTTEQVNLLTPSLVWYRRLAFVTAMDFERNHGVSLLRVPRSSFCFWILPSAVWMHLCVHLKGQMKGISLGHQLQLWSVCLWYCDVNWEEQISTLGDLKNTAPFLTMGGCEIPWDEQSWWILGRLQGIFWLKIIVGALWMPLIPTHFTHCCARSHTWWISDVSTWRAQGRAAHLLTEWRKVVRIKNTIIQCGFLQEYRKQHSAS